MSDIAIRVENLSKLYPSTSSGAGHSGRARQHHDTLRDAIEDFRLQIVDFGRRSRKSSIDNQKSEILWALKDVSFEVQRGEVVGVIGRNGAGKSTLLKIVSRITAPTTGRAEIHGRAALGQAEGGRRLPPRADRAITLNGATLCVEMKRAEIDRKFTGL